MNNYAISDYSSSTDTLGTFWRHFDTLDEMTNALPEYLFNTREDDLYVYFPGSLYGLSARGWMNSINTFRRMYDHDCYAYVSDSPEPDAGNITFFQSRRSFVTVLIHASETELAGQYVHFPGDVTMLALEYRDYYYPLIGCDPAPLLALPDPEQTAYHDALERARAIAAMHMVLRRNPDVDWQALALERVSRAQTIATYFNKSLSDVLDDIHCGVDFTYRVMVGMA